MEQVGMPWLTAALTQCLPTARDAWLWGECCCAGERPWKKESTFVRTGQNLSGGGETTWSSSCNGVHWGNIKELELVSYTKDLEKMMSYLALNSVLRNDTMFNVLECFLKTFLGFLHSPQDWDMHLQPRLSKVNLLHWSFIADHGQRYSGCSKSTSSLCELFTFLWTLDCYDFYLIWFVKRKSLLFRALSCGFPHSYCSNFNFVLTFIPYRFIVHHSMV